MDPLAPGRRRIDVVAAVVQQTDGRFLLAQRPPGKVYAGYWEFPGGKIEVGETSAAALAREMHEELGIVVDSAYPWLVREYDYSHAHVRLRFFRVRAWHGALQGREAQDLVWQRPGKVDVGPILPANGPIFAALALPELYGITGFAETDVDAALPAVVDALDHGLRLIQIRAKDWPNALRASFASAVVERARPYGAKILINQDITLARRLGAHGVHLTSRQLADVNSRPNLPLVAASCHDATDIAKAAALGLDFAVLGPVCATPTHPDAPLLGWDGLRALAAAAPLPLYAIGGMRRADLELALGCGAHGIAMVRGAWPASLV